ncbi:SAM-dependent methyltransferase [Trebonia sp.]|uniref:SAM-dependent methyltransferase n=1 Tax=Trebonia sp. TaxID=2767075 RepID=UPI00262DF04E|nr:SAM-dependent methyltransferase [Trebonia sp.]
MLDTGTPNIARAYDYLLGGGAHFAADRALAARLQARYPRTGEVLLSSRTFLADSLASIAARGIDQYIDVGSGLPTSPSAHEAARAVQPLARVVYVDRDPAVVRHAAALVPPGVRAVEGDLAEPEALLDAVAAFADLSRPACLILAVVLQVLDLPTARAVVGVLVRALAPGSWLVVSVGAGESGRLPDAAAAARGDFTVDDLASFLGGLELAPPGIRAGASVLCATGCKPARGGSRDG